MHRPPVAVLEVLLDAFFDRMHWFIFIFHEPSFRRSAGHVLSSSVWQRDELGTVLATLTASALGLLCVANDPSWTGHACLAEASLEACSLLDALIKEIRLHLLDLLDDCCIETVQVCSLLGAYYMFHASPALAWSILGMAVRTAYALTLHCDDDDQGYDPIVAQVRRRNWNHITVADTFAAMIYGRPVSLDAAFSLVQPLYDLDDTSLGPALSNHPLLSSLNGLYPDVTQLVFHVLKFRLYEIIRQALNRFRVLRLQNPISPEDLMSLVKAVQHIRSLLQAWRTDLPPMFDFDPGSRESNLGDLANITGLSPEEQKVRRHLSHQILTLQVTYDGAVIFVHRPLLEYRVAADSRQALSSQALEVVAESMSLSVNAALHMSHIPVAELEKQFAISFVLMNFFTAGVILCIPPTTWPLSSIAHEAKAGTLCIIRTNRNLKHVSQIATHTEQLLTRLLKLSLQLELDNGLQQEGADVSEGGSLPRGFVEQPMRSSGHAHSPNKNEARAGDTRGVPIPKRHTQLQTPSKWSPQSSTETLPANTNQGHFPLRYDAEIDGNIELIQPSTDDVYNENHMVSSSDLRSLTMGYTGQSNQVDSQLDEAFGTFGQSKSSLTCRWPHIPPSASSLLRSQARKSATDPKYFILVLFNLVPNDPYSAWNWGSGGF